MGLPARLARELVKASPVALRLDKGLPLGRWQEIGQQLCAMERGVQWWIGDWWAFGNAAYGERAAAAASGIFGRTFQGLMDLGSIARKFETSRRREVLSFSHYREVAALDPWLADGLLDEAEDYDLPVHELRARVHGIRRNEHLARNEKINLGNTQLPMGRSYSVIYADPPWRYENSDPRLDAENHYPTMPLDEICAMTVKTDVAADDAILYLWTTAPMLVESFKVIPAWGFEYRTDMVWVKNRAGIGRLTRGQHEHLLIATRGKYSAPLNGTQPSSVIETESSVIAADRREHSVKPEAVYEIIEEIYPNNLVRKIELFARGAARPGWDVWGNQAKQSAA